MSGNDSIFVNINDEKESNNDKSLSPPRSSSIRFETSMNRLSMTSRVSFVVEEDRNTIVTTTENYDIAAKLVDAMRGVPATRSIKLRRNLLKDSGRVKISYYIFGIVHFR